MGERLTAYERHADFPPPHIGEDNAACARWYAGVFAAVPMAEPDPAATPRERRLCRLSASEYIELRRSGGVTCEEYCTVLVKRARYYQYLNQWMASVYDRLDLAIGAARQLVPDGSNGSALDALARAPLWNEGLNYDHGTGHGVGAWLCVHEGPFSIAERGSRTFSGEPLRDGVVSSIEPGYYKEGWGGVRIENLYVYRSVEPNGSSRKFLRLEPITWIPFDPDLIDDTLLNDDERTWIAEYHLGCVERLTPLLPETERYELQALIG